MNKSKESQVSKMRYDIVYWKEKDIDNKIRNVICQKSSVTIWIERRCLSKDGNAKTKIQKISDVSKVEKVAGQRKYKDGYMPPCNMSP